jgi:hypothetical protein
MSDFNDEKLDEMLKSRRLEPAGPDLAPRIILKAQQTPQNQISLTEWMKRLFAEFHLPRPAYVIACALIFGILVGLYNPLDTATDESDPIYLQSFLYADEEAL